jgi:hypothetical protein
MSWPERTHTLPVSDEHRAAARREIHDALVDLLRPDSARVTLTTA